LLEANAANNAVLVALGSSVRSGVVELVMRSSHPHAQSTGDSSGLTRTPGIAARTWLATKSNARAGTIKR
jgi:hypothetical protein